MKDPKETTSIPKHFSLHTDLMEKLSKLNKDNKKYNTDNLSLDELKELVNKVEAESLKK